MQVMDRDETICQVMYRVCGSDPEKCGYILVPRGPGAHQDIPAPKPRKTREDTLLLTRLFNHFDIKNKSDRDEITRRLFDRRWEKEAEALAKRICKEKGWRLAR